MANNNPYIDPLLLQQLGSLEQLPDETAFNKIMIEMDKLHPIDYSLSQNLKDNDAIPNFNSEQQLFSTIANHTNTIDSVLNQKLSILEETPQLQWADIAPKIVTNRKRRGLVLLFLLGAIALGSVYLYKNNQTKNVSSSQDSSHETLPFNETTKTQETKKSPNSLNNVNTNKVQQNIESESDKNHHLNQEEQEGKNVSKVIKPQINKRKYKISNNSWTHEDATDLPKTFEEINLPNLQYNDLQKTKTKTKIDEISTFIYSGKPYHSYFKKKLSPLFFGAAFGYISEHTMNNTISNQNIHKDAVSVFSQATGINRNGYVTDFYIGYRLQRNLRIKAGITYSYTSVKSTMNYTFTEIPIFNPDGTIAKYGKRPAAGSPEAKGKNENENTSLALPVLVSFKFMESNKFSAWAEGGSQILLRNKFNTKLFSFLNAELINTSEVKPQKLIPITAIALQYQLRPYLHLTVRFQTSYGRKLFYLENYYFKKNEISPSFNFGIIYNPLIKQ